VVLLALAALALALYASGLSDRLDELNATLEEQSAADDVDRQTLLDQIEVVIGQNRRLAQQNRRSFHRIRILEQGFREIGIAPPATGPTQPAAPGPPGPPGPRGKSGGGNGGGNGGPPEPDPEPTSPDCEIELGEVVCVG
jgi:hypothetical protein